MNSLTRNGRIRLEKEFEAIENDVSSPLSKKFVERTNSKLKKEVFEAFWSWAEKIALTVLPKTQLGKAFEYAFKRGKFLGNYFKGGDCAISNNAAENAIRPFTGWAGTLKRKSQQHFA